MHINEIACMLEAWRGRREALDAQLDALSLLTMAAPECPLFSAIEDIWMAYTVSVSQIVGDKAEWLQWYWLERDMGNKPGEVTVSGQNGIEAIVVDKDIRSLAEVIARVKP